MNRNWLRETTQGMKAFLVFMIIGGTVVADENAPIDFNRDIRPILSDKCFTCHGPDNNRREAELRLDKREDALLDRDGHAVIVAGDVGNSGLIARITSDDESERMPPADSLKELSNEEIALLKRWVAGGAPYEIHWAYAPLKRPQVPEAKPSLDADGVIDRFLREFWKSKGVTANSQADPVTLVRRLSLDLLGLPPTAAQVERFRQSPSDQNWRSLVDEMLESPHYGERMAVYWLDLVRYADSVGYHGDQEHAITPYRDYVIKSFNDNKPFDQFTLEQLAGDLIPDGTEEQLIGSGYNRVLQTSHEGGVQVQEYLTKYSADRVRNLSAVWLGATVGCAECHDHKYDPYTQRDFYSLAAFFADLDDVSSFKGGNTLPTKRDPEAVVLSPIDAARLIEVETQLAALKKAELKKAELKKTEGQGEDAAPAATPAAEKIAQLEERKEELLGRRRRTMISKSIEPRVTRILERGDWMDKSGEVVLPATPGFLPDRVASENRASRIELARWLTSGQQPQTSRVLANRLWYLSFGAGLSPNLDDSGSQGTPPMIPELLDWLAMELIESGWDVKHTIRLIANSRAYRMSSVPTQASLAHDPGNAYFGRQNRYRLPAEFIRDTALHVSGMLNAELGGPSSRPYQPAGYYAHLNFPTRTYKPDSDSRQFRRGVYVHWQRQFLHPMLRAFDAPTREECTAERPRSNTPLAALTLLNDPTFVEAARGLAEWAIQEGPPDSAGRITWIWKRVLNRSPDSVELEILNSYYEKTTKEIAEADKEATKILTVGIQPVADSIDKQELAAWTAVTRAVLNLNETVTRN